MTKTDSRSPLSRIAFVLLWTFVFTIPLVQATEIPGIDIISKAIGAGAFLAGVGAMAARRKIRDLGSVHFALAGFVLWSAVTLCWSIAPQLTMERITNYLELFAMVVMLWEGCRGERDVLQILGAFVLGTIVPGLSTLKAFLPGERILYERSAVAGFDPNALAFLLALSLPVSYYLILKEKSAIKALYRLQMGIAVGVILLTGSGAAMVAMLVGLSLVFWTLHAIPAHTRRNAFFVLMLLGGAAVAFFPASVWQQLSADTRNGSLTFTTMVNNQMDSVQSVPLRGLGAGAAAEAGVAAQLHGSMTMFAETGLVGVVCFIAVLGVLFLAAERMAGVTRSFWFTVLGVWMVGVCCLSWECSQPAWLLFGLLAAQSSPAEETAPEVQEPEPCKITLDESAEVWS